MGQPLGMPSTLRELAGASPGNIMNVPPQNAAEQVAPMPVVHSGGTVALKGKITTGVSGQVASTAFDTATFDNGTFDGPLDTNALREPVPVSPPYVEPSQPRDDFARAAAEAALNPDPAVEREIFEYGGKKEIESLEAGGATAGEVRWINDAGQQVTFSNDKGEATLHGRGTVAANAQILERSLLERPADIRDAARVLVKEIKDQVEQLQRSKPNDDEGLAKHNEFVEFLERIAAGLAELADALDQAINPSVDGPPEPMFLGKTARITEQLNVGMMEWLEANRTNLMGCTLRIGLNRCGLFVFACVRPRRQNCGHRQRPR